MSQTGEVRQGIIDCYPRLWRFCVSLAGQRETAEDLAQMTCLRAIEQSDKFTPGTHLDRWLFVMARRVWLNELRREKIRQSESFTAEVAETIAGHGADMETNIFAREVFNKATTLPEAQRSTALLVFVEGYSYAETADILDIPIGTVMSRISAARKTLSQHVNRNTGTET